jgi:hypothetical protein
MSAPSNPTITAPNYDPSYPSQVHGGINAAFGPLSQTRRATITLQLINDDGDSVGATTLKSFYKSGPTNAYYNYKAILSGGYNSVTGNTKIRLADGTTKLAKNITLDDKILSWDDDRKKWVSASISHIHKRDIDKVYKVTLSNGNEIEVSDDHKFYLFGTEFNSGHVNVQTLYNALKAGDDLSQDGLKLWIKDNDSRTQVTVTNVEIIKRQDDAITYTVPHYVNYLSNDIISHNVYPPGGGALSWSYEEIQAAYSGTGTQTSSSETVEKTINITEAGNIRARYKWEIGAASGRTFSVAANGTLTYSYHTDTNTFKTNTATANYTARFYSNGGYSYGAWDSSISLEVENNFVEIRPAGIQVVSNNDRFVRIARRELTDTNPDLFTVSDGTAYFYARGGSFPAAIVSDGDINPYSDSNHDLGSNSVRWANLYTDNINGLDASAMAVSLTDVITGTTGVTSVSDNLDSYVKLPGGVIIQWGTVNQGTTYGSKTVQFPTSFTTSISAAVCSTLRNNQGGSGFNHVHDVDKNGMQIVLDGTSGFWIAIGH